MVGEFLPFRSEWDFLVSDFRFAPEIENQFKINYYSEQEKRLEAEQERSARKRRGYVFTYAGDIEPYLVKWGYCSQENRQYVAAQIASGFLSRLRTFELLHKAPGSNEWRVIRNTFT